MFVFATLLATTFLFATAIYITYIYIVYIDIYEQVYRHKICVLYNQYNLIFFKHFASLLIFASCFFFSAPKRGMDPPGVIFGTFPNVRFLTLSHRT